MGETLNVLHVTFPSGSPPCPKYKQPHGSICGHDHTNHTKDKACHECGNHIIYFSHLKKCSHIPYTHINPKNTPPATITAMLVDLRFNDFVVVEVLVRHQRLTIGDRVLTVREHLDGIRVLTFVVRSTHHHIHHVVLVV